MNAEYATLYRAMYTSRRFDETAHDLFTQRILIGPIHTYSFGAAAEIVARVTEHGFDSLDAPIRRVCLPDVPIPFAGALEDTVVPGWRQIAEAVRGIM
jgi:pyruvate dehydrogenase E1 component beta subunit